METVTWAAFRFLSCDRHLILKKEKLSNSLLHSLVQILCWIYETNFLPPASLLVAAGFPSGQTPLETKLAEIKLAVQYGAREIDIVISRSLVLSGQWESKSPQARNLNLYVRACVSSFFVSSPSFYISAWITWSLPKEWLIIQGTELYKTSVMTNGQNFWK